MKAPTVYSSSIAGTSGHVNGVQLPDGVSLVKGWFGVDKFGNNPDIDTATAPEDVWDGPSLGAPNQYVFSTAAIIDTVSSSSAADTGSLTISGLDANWEFTVQTVTMLGQTQVILPTPLIRSFRMIYQSPTLNAGNIYCYESGAATAGVPNVLSTVRAVIRIGIGQTLMAIYTTPENYDSYIGCFFAGIGGVGIPTVDRQGDLQVRWGVAASGYPVKRTFSLSTKGTGYLRELFAVAQFLPPRTDVIVKCTAVDANNTRLDGGFSIIHNPIL